VSFHCPHCNSLQVIPRTPTRTPTSPVSLQTLAADEKLNSTRLPKSPITTTSSTSSSSTSDPGLWSAQERLWQNEHQSAEQAVALVERDQRISALRAESDWLASQLDEERQRRQALEPDLDIARGQWAAAEKRANEFENSYQHAANRLAQVEMEAAELTHQLELVKTERSEAVLDLANQHETQAEMNLELNQARAERTEMEQILGRARTDLERSTQELASAEAVSEQSAAEASQLTAALAQVRAELGLAVSQRDKLQSLVSEDHDLSNYVEVRTDRDKFEHELKETQTRHATLHEKIASLTDERDGLRKERMELLLKVAALRDAHEDTQLQQDNEILRRMVERLTEEIKEAQPQIARHRRKASTGGMMGNIARAVAQRCFVPDADMAEER
jgi:chromosome segregation ATPase